MTEVLMMTDIVVTIIEPPTAEGITIVECDAEIYAKD